MAEEDKKVDRSFDKGFEQIGKTVNSVSGILKDSSDAFSSLLSVMNGVSGAVAKTSSDFSALAGSAESLTQLESVMGIMETAGGGLETASGLLENLGNGFGSISNVAKVFGDGISKMSSGVLSGLQGIGSAMGIWSSEMTKEFEPILAKVSSFGSMFFQMLGLGAGIGLVVAGLGLLQSAYGEQIDALLTMMMEKGPELITNLCMGITTALPALMEQGALLLNNLMLAIAANLPALLAGGFSIISGLITGIDAQLPLLIPTAITLILTLIQGLLDNLPQLISSGLTLIMGLAEGLINAIPILIAMAPGLIQSLIAGIVTMIPQIILTGIQLITQLALGLIEAIPQLVKSLPEIIDAIKNGFTSIDWGELGSDIIEGIGNGIKKVASKLKDLLCNAAKAALDGVKSLFGINSPSRVFRDEVGKMMAIGMGIGFERNVPVKELGNGAVAALDTVKKQAYAVVSYGGTGVSRMKLDPANQFAAGVFDFDEFERRQRKIEREKMDRPVFLNGRQVNRAMKKGGPVLA